MRRIVVVGAGPAGLLLALGLQQHGYAITIVAERDAETLRNGRVISNQCLFEPALRHERELGVNLWDGRAPEITGVAIAAAGEPGAQEPSISWQTPLDRYAQSVDQRLKMSDWMAEFTRLGHTEPQRAISLIYLAPAGAEPLPVFPGVSFGFAPEGRSSG
jgi:glycine/D-amino acid oxidase-like deaminating enzyme